MSTSVKSVADYFKEKMEAKKKAASMFVSGTSTVKTETLETQLKVESEVLPIKSEEGEEENKARVKAEKKEKKKKRKEKKAEEQVAADEEEMKIEAPEIVLADLNTGTSEKKKKKKKRDKGENTEPNAAEKIKTAGDHESGEQRSDIKKVGDGDDAETETKRVKKKRKREQSSI